MQASKAGNCIVAFSKITPQFLDLLVRKARFGSPFSNCGGIASLCMTIFHVICLCANKEMVRTHALRTITVMTYKKALWNLVVKKCVCKPMSRDVAIINTKASVAVAISKTSPKPAGSAKNRMDRAALVHFFQEAFYNRPFHSNVVVMADDEPKWLALDIATLGIGLKREGGGFTAATHAQAARVQGFICDIIGGHRNLSFRCHAPGLSQAIAGAFRVVLQELSVPQNAPI